MGRIRAAAFAMIAWGALFAFASNAYADSVATTGPATSLMPTSVTLNGVVSDPGVSSIWTFQYGTTTSYTNISGTHPVQSGLRAVSETISGLTPGATYHYRLIVIQSYPQRANTGDDMSFTTPKVAQPSKPTRYGKVSLAHRRLKVRHGVVAMRFSCRGAAGAACQGSISLSTRARAGSRVVSVRCGKGKFVASAGHSHTVRAKVGRTCDALLKSVPRHHLAARLKAMFSTHQTPLRTAVTLVGT